MHLKHIKKLKQLREVLNKNLYSSHTLLTYDLILDILEAHIEGRSLTIKELCTDSIKSQLNTRKHLNLLKDEGWIVFSNGVHDKRLRLVKATDKLINLVDRIIAGWN